MPQEHLLGHLGLRRAASLRSKWTTTWAQAQSSSEEIQRQAMDTTKTHDEGGLRRNAVVIADGTLGLFVRQACWRVSLRNFFKALGTQTSSDGTSFERKYGGLASSDEKKSR
jgi:hypothetical protein